MAMTSSRPYLVRALYDWIVENDCTPYVLVNAFGDGVEVPQEHVRDGQIILNISPLAVNELFIESDGLHFEGRFGGIPKFVSVPMAAVMGIYARENGQGMMFDPEAPEPTPDPKGPGGGDRPPTPRGPARKSGGKKPASRPSLRLVK